MIVTERALIAFLITSPRVTVLLTRRTGNAIAG
jgi:hypothetical protein